VWPRPTPVAPPRKRPNTGTRPNDWRRRRSPRQIVDWPRSNYCWPTRRRPAPAQQAAAAKPEPTHIRGDYGSTAYVRKSWTFEVVALDEVPRDYMSLDVDVVREAITKDAVREIPGLRIYQAETLHVRGAA